MRVFVAWQKEKLVIPVKDHKKKNVGSLLKTITSRFCSHTGNESLRFVQLTNQGFLLNAFDPIDSVVADNDVLQVVDYSDWVTLQEPLLKDEWLKVSVWDFVDSEYKWAVVGLHEHNSIYVSVGNKKNRERLEVFNKASLTDFAKEGKLQVCRIQKPGKKEGCTWFAEASFIVKGEKVEAIQLAVKVCADSQPLIKQISFSTSPFAPGKEELIQKSWNAPDVKVDMPKDVSTGGVITDPPLDPPKKTKSNDFNDNKSSGGSTLVFEQIDEVFAEQRGGYEKFDQSFYCEFLVSGEVKETCLKNIKSEYKDKKGEWQPFDETTAGSKSGFYNYRMNYQKPYTNYKCVGQRVATRSYINIKKPMLVPQRRAHDMFPCPLEIRITFEDDKSKTTSITVTYTNGPMEANYLKTKAYLEKSKEITKYFKCDDTSCASRLSYGVTESKDRYDASVVEISFSQGSGGNLNKNSLREIGYTATEPLVPLDYPSVFDKEPYVAKAFAMVSLEHKFVYGIKFEMKTSTSSTVAHYKIPLAVYD